MSRILGRRTQTALLWPLTGYNDNGDPVVSDTAVELAPPDEGVRWEPVEREVTGPNGSPIQINAAACVDRDIAVGSIMWLGGLADIPGTGDAPTADLMQVVSFDKVPHLREIGTFYREVGLSRWNDTEIPFAS